MSPRVGDIGTAIEIIVLGTDGVTPEDISDATVKTIKLLKPDGTLLTKTAAFTTDGTDGKIRYITQDGDLDQAGRWQIEGEITTPSGFWSTEIIKIKVGRSL